MATKKKREVGFRPDGTPYPGVDALTGERKSLTYAGAQEEFGKAEGVRLYNQIAVIYGGVPSDRRPLNLRALADDRAIADLSEERMEKRRLRRERVMIILANAEREAYR